MERENFSPCFCLTCAQILKTLFYRNWFPRSLQSSLLLLLLEAIPLESDTCVFPMELEVKAWRVSAFGRPLSTALGFEHCAFQPSPCILVQLASHPTYPSDSRDLWKCSWGCPEPVGGCPLSEADPPTKQTSWKSQTAAVHCLDANQYAKKMPIRRPSRLTEFTRNFRFRADSLAR